MEQAIDAAATIGTGALLAREADRVHVPDRSGHDASGACANCEATLTGPFCSACGQHGHVHRTAGALLHDLLHGVFHFEGKLWATLPMLAWKPGELTRRYVHGERAKFVSPMALFLFSVFLLFAVVSNLPNMAIGSGAFGTGKVTLEGTREKLVEERRKAVGEVARLQQQIARRRAAPSADQVDVSRLERRLAEAQESARGLTRAIDLMGTEATADAPKAGHASESWLEGRWRHARENPKLLIYKLKSSAYKWSWALIPISLPFIWLLFPLRRKVGMYDHAIFATYSLSFMSLLVVALGVLNWLGIPSAPLILLALILPVIHIFRQLKGAYQLSWPGAIWRTWLMLWFITIIVPLFSLFLLYLGVAD